MTQGMLPDPAPSPPLFTRDAGPTSQELVGTKTFPEDAVAILPGTVIQRSKTARTGSTRKNTTHLSPGLKHRDFDYSNDKRAHSIGNGLFV